MHTFIEMFEEQERLKLLRHNEAEKLAYERMLDRKVTLPPPPPDPGVYEDDIHPPGEHWVTILLPSGKVGSVHFPEELWDENVIPHLWKRYHAKTRAKLKIV